MVIIKCMCKALLVNSQQITQIKFTSFLSCQFPLYSNVVYLTNVVATRGGDWLKHNFLTTNTSEHVLNCRQESCLDEEWRINMLTSLNTTHIYYIQRHMCIPATFQGRNVLWNLYDCGLLVFLLQTLVSFGTIHTLHTYTWAQYNVHICMYMRTRMHTHYTHTIYIYIYICIYIHILNYY